MRGVRVEYIGDDKRDIVDTVLRMRQYVGPHGWLFTSGGLGATHDDKTYDAIASAFGGELKRHAETVTLMEKHYAERGVELNESRLRMADLPHPADEVLFAPGLWVPLVVINNVFVLPGIPGLFQRMLTAHIERFKGPQAYEATLYTRAGEELTPTRRCSLVALHPAGDLAVGLARIAGASPRVRIGSYPNTDLSAIYDPSAKYRVKLQLESRDPEALDAAVKAVQSKFATFELATARGVVQRATEAVTSTAAAAKDSAVGAAQAAKDTAVGAAQAAKDTAVGAAQAAVEKAGGVLQSAKEAVGLGSKEEK
eukprot:scaffold3.g6355.t1